MGKLFTKILLFIFCINLLCFTKNGNAQTISTEAGNGGTGYYGDGGQATSATLYDPNGVAVDDSGNVYIADLWNEVVRKVNTNGIISTVAGTGKSGYSGDGGQATAAQINIPASVFLDSHNNIYIADQGNEVIRKVDTKGVITTIAGNTYMGYSGDGGPATDAELSMPTGVTVDIKGNVYIAEFNNSTIRKVDTNGIITTIAGNDTEGYSGDGGAATDAQLTHPYGVNVDTIGNVYIADMYNERVRKVDKNGIINTIAGTGQYGYSGDGGPATDAELSHLEGVHADDSGNVYIADWQNNRIRKINTNGIITTIAGNGNAGFAGDGGPATIAELNGPTGIAISNSGNIYISDWGNSRIREIANPCLFALSVSPMAPSICSGQKITLKVNGKGNDYQWSPATALSATTGDSVFANPTSNITYTVTYDSGSCQLSTTEVVTIDTATLTIAPEAPLVCSGQNITLTASGGSDFVWSPALGLNTTAGDSVVSTATASITYSVTGVDSAGCKATGSDVLSIIPAPNKPVITVSVTDDSLISSADSYNQWNLNNTVLSDSIRRVLVIKDKPKGAYTVTVENPANGCTTTSDSLVTSGVYQMGINNVQLSVYPNPTVSGIVLTISAQAENLSEWNMKICDVIGQTVYTQQYLNYVNYIDLSALPSGMYFINVINKAEQNVLMIVKQN